MEAFEVSSPSSRIEVAAAGWDPVAELTERDLGSAHLADVQALLEWTFGYRRAASSGRATRRSPSAGALYPTEVIVVWSDQAGTHADAYDFVRRRFVRLRTSGSAGRPRTWARSEFRVLLASAIGRSASKYGARSYLYALLEVGHVAANLMRLGRWFGVTVDSGPPLPDQEECEALGLPSTLPVLASLSLSIPRRAWPLPFPPETIEVEGRPEPAPDPPCSEDRIKPALRFHARGIHGRGAPDLDWVRRIELSEPLDRQIERRHSAADFGDAGLDDRTTHELLTEIRRTCGEGRRRLSKLRCHLISIGLGDQSRLLSVDLDGDLSTAEDFDARNAAGRLREACQDQSLVGRADLALVLLVDLGRRPTLGHSQFRHAAILAGAICADLYAIAADLEIGTTTIGGIDSTLLVELLGLSPTHFPLCIQLFGPERDAAVKLDATDHEATNRRLRSATGRDPSRAPKRRR